MPNWAKPIAAVVSLALIALGERLRARTDIVVGGAGGEPDIGRLQEDIRAVAEHLEMKLFAGRPRDLTDIVALSPTPRELQFVRSELPRLRRIDQPRAARLESLLDQYHDDPT